MLYSRARSIAYVFCARNLVWEESHLKGGCAHFDMCKLNSKLIDFDPQDTFCTILPKPDFPFSLLGQKQVCDTRDETVRKIHTKIKMGIPEIGSFSAITSKV